MSGRRQQGFTLLEIMVAALITTIVVASAYTGLTSAAKNRQKIEARFDRFQEIQLSVRLLTQDLYQVQPRPVRDLVGQDQLPAIMTADSDNGIEMTVGGYNNPLNLRRSEQQRVGYEIEDNILYRVQWLVLDRTQASVPIRKKLLEDVLSMSIRFLDAQQDWKESWPPPAGSSIRQMPQAVEITVEIEDVGIIRRVVELAG